MGKSLILNRLKKHWKLKNDTALADYLGIGQNTLASWKSRNTFNYDVIIAKCNDLESLLILTEKETEFNSYLDNNKISGSNDTSELLQAYRETIESQKETINTQKNTLETHYKVIGILYEKAFPNRLTMFPRGDSSIGKILDEIEELSSVKKH